MTTHTTSAVEALRAYIVWNAARDEGVVFVGEEGCADAVQCVTGEFDGISSALGNAFAEIYDDEDLTIQEINLASLEQTHASDCAVHNAPALEPGACDCGQENGSRAVPRLTINHNTGNSEMNHDREVSEHDLECLHILQRRVDAGQGTDRDLQLVAARMDGGFHWKHDTYFKRLHDGSVRIRTWRRAADGYPTYDDRTIDPQSWASIVCSVSADGETSARWDAAQDFHGRVEIKP